MARNLELEAVILDDPDDVEAYRVYADWLELQDDPRGKLIALSLAYEADPYEKLQVDIETHMRRHASQLLGPLAECLGAPYSIDGLSSQAHWHRGFIRELAIERQFTEPFAAVLEQVLAHPSSALVRRIRFHDSDREETELAAAIEVLARAPRSLHSLYFDVPNPGSLESLYSLTTIDDVGFGNAFARNEPARACERVLWSLARAPWRLRKLVVSLGDSRLSPEPLVELLARSDLPLVELEIEGREQRNAGLARALVHALIESPLVAQLERLVFRVPNLKRAEHVRLVEAAPRFTKLRRLALASQRYTQRMLDGTPYGASHSRDDS